MIERVTKYLYTYYWWNENVRNHIYEYSFGANICALNTKLFIGTGMM